jgi:hypothetical protein
MAGWTNRGKFLITGTYFQGDTAPTNFYVALATDATAPTADTNTLSELTEIAAGNGYTSGGISLSRNATDFDTQTETDASDIAFVQIRDLVWTASGGSLPGSGSGARYAVLTTDEVTVGNRQIVAWWDLTSARTVSSGQTLTLQNCELRLTE